MVPDLNLLTAAPEFKNGQGMVAGQQGENTLEVPSDGSFGAILAGQEATSPVPPEAQGEGALPPPVGGNAGRQGGNTLPLPPVPGTGLPASAELETAISSGAVEGAELDLPATAAPGVPAVAGSELIASLPGESANAQSVVTPAAPAPGLPAGPEIESPAIDPATVKATAATGAATPAAATDITQPVVSTGGVLPARPDPGRFAARGNDLAAPGLSRPAMTPQATPGVSPNPVIGDSPGDAARLQQLAVQQADPVVAGAGSGLEAMDLVESGERSQTRHVGNAAPAASLGAAPVGLEPAQSGALRSGIMGSMSVPPGHANWNDEFVGHVNMLVKNGVNEARLQLNPAELGHLEVKITTEGDRAVVLFNAQHAVTREAIDQAMPRLREMLENSGLQLVHSEVADQSQSQRGEGGTPGGQDADPFAHGAAPEEPESLDDTAYRLSADGSSSLVDYYA